MYSIYVIFRLTMFYPLFIFIFMFILFFVLIFYFIHGNDERDYFASLGINIYLINRSFNDCRLPTDNRDDVLGGHQLQIGRMALRDEMVR